MAHEIPMDLGLILQLSHSNCILRSCHDSGPATQKSQDGKHKYDLMREIYSEL